MESKHHVTVVVAARDEARTIGPLIERSRLYAADVIVVDGHSRDATAAIAAAAGARVLTDHGLGKGEALRVGIDAVATGIIVFMDADGSHDPDDIPRLAEPIVQGRADHVSGSRLMGGSSELHGGFDEFLRLTGSSLITACINWRFGVRLSESQNGFRAIRTDVARQLHLRGNLTTIEQEMIVKTLRLGFRMGEVPTHEYKRAYGTSHIVLWRVAPIYVVSLLWHLFLSPIRASGARASTSTTTAAQTALAGAPAEAQQVVRSPRIGAHG